MPRIIKCALTQTRCELSGDEPVDKIRDHMIEKHLKFVEDAGQAGRPDPVFSGTVHRSVFCRRTKHQVVRSDGKNSLRARRSNSCRKRPSKHNMVIVAPYL